MRSPEGHGVVSSPQTSRLIVLHGRFPLDEVHAVLQGASRHLHHPAFFDEGLRRDLSYSQAAARRGARTTLSFAFLLDRLLTWPTDQPRHATFPFNTPVEAVSGPEADQLRYTVAISPRGRWPFQGRASSWFTAARRCTPLGCCRAPLLRVMGACPRVLVCIQLISPKRMTGDSITPAPPGAYHLCPRRDRCQPKYRPPSQRPAHPLLPHVRFTIRWG